MAKPTIGLDIGTTAVRAAELRGKDPATLVRFAQLTLPPGAMISGEISDVDAIAEVVKDLWRRGGYSSKRVAVSVSNPSVVARQVELPAMDEEELRGALEYKVQDYIPIPVQDALLDFLLLDEFASEEGTQMMRVLAVAAQRDMIAKFVDVVTRAGLEPVSVDMGALSALRALVDTTGSILEGERAEAIVDIGGGVTTVTVHIETHPRFVRILSSGGADITTAIATELGLSVEDAEARKIATSLQPEGSAIDPGVPTIVEQRARAFIDDVRRSLEYYQGQPGAARLQRVIVVGGGSRLRRLAERLATALRLPVEEGDAFERIKVGEIGLSDDQLEQVAAVGAVAIGLALEAG